MSYTVREVRHNLATKQQFLFNCLWWGIVSKKYNLRLWNFTPMFSSKKKWAFSIYILIFDPYELIFKYG